MAYQGIAITQKGISEIVKKYQSRVASVGYGVTWVHVTKDGGVFSGGTKVKMPAAYIEFAFERTYVLLEFYGYPKGTIIHVFDPRDKNSVKKATIESLLEDVVSILQEYTPESKNGFVKHDHFM
jgi:hypothetical protein